MLPLISPARAPGCPQQPFWPFVLGGPVPASWTVTWEEHRSTGIVARQHARATCVVDALGRPSLVEETCPEREWPVLQYHYEYDEGQLVAVRWGSPDDPRWVERYVWQRWGPENRLVGIIGDRGHREEITYRFGPTHPTNALPRRSAGRGLVLERQVRFGETRVVYSRTGRVREFHVSNRGSSHGLLHNVKVAWASGRLRSFVIDVEAGRWVAWYRYSECGALLEEHVGNGWSGHHWIVYRYAYPGRVLLPETNSPAPPPCLPGPAITTPVPRHTGEPTPTPTRQP